MFEKFHFFQSRKKFSLINFLAWSFLERYEGSDDVDGYIDIVRSVPDCKNTAQYKTWRKILLLSSDLNKGSA